MKKITLLLFLIIMSFSGYAQLPLQQFDTWPVDDDGWAIYQNTVGTNITWVLGPANNTSLPAYSPARAAYLNRGNVPTGNPVDWLITKSFTVPVNGQVRFYSRLLAGGDQGNTYDVKITTGGQLDVASYVSLIDADGWTETELNSQQIAYEERVINIPASYVGQQVHIAFVMTGVNNGDRWLLDDVSVQSQCFNPTNLAVTATTTGTATVNFGNPSNANVFEIEVVPNADTPSGTGEIYNGFPPFTIPDLNPNTDYKVYVRAVCATGNTSDWIGPAIFSTRAFGETCAEPISITTLPYGTTDNTGNYADIIEGTPGATGCGTTGSFLNGFEVIYSYTATFNGLVSINMTNNGANSGMFVYTSCANIGTSCAAGGTGNATTPVSIPNFGVTAGQTYYIVISTSGTTASTPYTLTIQQVNCTQPANGTSTATANSATLSWSNPSGASAWQVVVQAAGSGLPTGTSTILDAMTNTNFPVGPLTEATAYEFYVRADCGNGTYSAWAGPYTFNTTQIPATLPYTQDFEGANSGFTLNNGTQPNKWFVGNAVNNGGTRSLYISNDNGLTNGYNNGTASTVQAYRDVLIPAGAGDMSVSFDWRAVGEGATWDYMRVFLMPATYNPVAGTEITPAIATANGGVQLGGTFNLNANWANVNYTVNATPFANSTRRLVFQWRNDGSLGSPPAAAVDNINISLITCRVPTNLAVNAASVTTSSATVTWTAPTNSGTPVYDYYLSTSNTAPNASTVPTEEDLAGTSATINTLQPSTTYYFWVRSDCGTTDGTSFWVGPVTIVTPQIPATLNYSDDFEGTPQWTLVNGTQANKWFIGTAVNNGGTKSLYISNDNGTSHAYTTGTASATQAYRDLAIPTGANEIEVQFDWRANGEGTTTLYDYLRVFLMPVTYNPVAGTEITPAIATANGGVQLGGTFNLNNNWNTSSYTVNPAAFAGQTRRLIFQWRNDGSLGSQAPAAIDNVNVSVVTCRKPQNLTAGSQTQTTAQLGWTEMNGSTNWQVVVLPLGSPAPPLTATGTPVSGTPTYTAGSDTPLNPGTGYVFYVRTDCGDPNGLSSWAGPFTFYTLIANDECADAINVPVNQNSLCTLTTPGTITGATGSPQPNACAGNANDDVWFEFTATHTQHYIALLDTQVVTGPEGPVNGSRVTLDDLNHAVYSGECGTLTQLQCNTNNNSIINNLVPGQTYKIRVYSSASTLQTFSFNVCVGIVMSCNDSTRFCDNGNPFITFTGSVGVPSVGSESCLGTTPNPTFFTVLVDQTGPIAFNISQTSFTGAPIDVDFIAYGPFNSADFSCQPGLLVPANQVACSYSIAAVENFTIPNAQSGQLYIVKITNFNGSRSTVNFSQTNLNQPGAGTTDCTGICEVDFGPDQVLCGATNYVLDATIINADGYTWYFNDGTGEVEIAGADGPTYTATQTGTYRVLVDKPLCDTPPTDEINITFGPTVDIAEPEEVTVCGENGNAEVDLAALNAAILGTLNPADYVVEYYLTEAAATAGTAGAIDTSAPFATTTQVIYVRVESAIAGICFDVEPLQITVNTSPDATIAYADSPFCSNETTGNVTLTGNVGGAYSSTAGLTIDPVSGAIDIAASTPGVYTVTYTIAATDTCEEFSTSTDIEIVDAPDATITYADSPYCSSGGTATVTQTGTAGGTYTSTAGLVIDPATGEIDLTASTAGTYTVTYTIAADANCAEATFTTEIVINEETTATIAYADSPYCSNEVTGMVTQTGVAGGTYTSTDGLVINPATGNIDIAGSTPGNYTITYTVAQTASCPEFTTTADIVIVDAPDASIAYADSPYCSSGGTATVTFTGTTGGTYTSTAGLVIDPATGEIDLAASTTGTYTVTYTIGADADCAEATFTTEITINQETTATIAYADSPYCSNEVTGTVTQTGVAGGIYTSTAGLVIDPATGDIDIAGSTPGNYTITYTVAQTASCPEFTTTADIVIVDAPDATIAYADSPYCSSGGTATVTLTGTTGGTYSSTAGLVIDPATGDIDLATSTAGTYTVTYTIAADADCAQFVTTTQIEINTVTSATISYAGTPFCTDGSGAVVTQTGNTGGTYSSTAGLVIDPVTGEIDLASSTGGVYTVTYTIAATASCPEFTTTATVDIFEAADATIAYSGTPYCSNAGTASVTLTGTTGGTYSSTGGLVIDPATGDIDLAASTAGVYTVTYTVAANGPCASLAVTAQVEITAIATATIAYGGTPYCSNAGTATVTQTGTTGGTYTSSAGLVINPATGEVNIAASTPGNYVVTYTIAPVGGCTAVTATANVTITQQPAAGFSYTFNQYCQNAGTVTATLDNGATAGTFTADVPGLALNGTNGSIDLAASTPGTYIVTNTIAAANGCGTATDSFTITVDPAAVATFSYTVAAYCQDDTNPSPVLNGVAGTFSSTNGLVIDPVTGEINVAQSTPGTYTVSNTTSGTAQCPPVTETTTVTINALPEVFITEGCDGSNFILVVNYEDDEFYTPDNTTIVWTNAGGTVLGSGPSLNLSEIGGGIGMYYATVTPTGTTCEFRAERNVTSTSCNIQRGISPNGDGLNEYFDLTALDVTKLSIFNRYGTKVFGYGAYTNQWHGQGDNGNELPTGTYFYSIERANGENMTGWVYINREER